MFYRITTGPGVETLPKPDPYYFCFGTMLGQALDGTPMDTEVHFRFDLAKQYKGRAQDTFYEIKTYGTTGRERQLESIDFPPYKKWPGLQAADMLVRGWYNTNVHVHPLNAENMRVMKALTKRNPHMYYADAKSLDILLNRLVPAENYREQLRQIPEPKLQK